MDVFMAYEKFCASHNTGGGGLAYFTAGAAWAATQAKFSQEEIAVIVAATVKANTPERNKDSGHQFSENKFS